MNIKNVLGKLSREKSEADRAIHALHKEIEERKNKIRVLQNEERIRKLQKKNKKLGGE